MLKLPAFILLLTYLLIFSTQASERKNSEKTLITPTKNILASSTGWLKNPEGDWIEKNNVILANLPINRRNMLASKEYGMGIDNFSSIEKFEINIKDKKYDLLIKSMNNGRYSSNSVYADWLAKFEYHYFIFEKGVFETIQAYDGKAILNKYPVKYSGYFHDSKPIPKDEYPHYLTSKINESKSSKGFTAYGDDYSKYLVINTYYYKKDDVIRWLLFRGCESIEYKYLAPCGGLARQSNAYESPAKNNSTLFVSKEMFEKLYFETNKNEFSKLIKVTHSEIQSLPQKKSKPIVKTQPSKTWVGKTLEVKFDQMGGKSISGKTRKIKLLRALTDSDGYELFQVKDLTDGYLKEVYFYWFDNKNGKQEWGPNIQSVKDITPKNLRNNDTMTKVNSLKKELKHLKIALDSVENNLGKDNSAYKTVKQNYDLKLKEIKTQQQ